MEKNKGLGYTGTPKQSRKQEQYGNRLRPPKLLPGPQMCQMPSLCPDYLFFQVSLVNSFPSLETLFPRCVPHLSQVDLQRMGKEGKLFLSLRTRASAQRWRSLGWFGRWKVQSNTWQVGAQEKHTSCECTARASDHEPRRARTLSCSPSEPVPKPMLTVRGLWVDF